MSPGEELHHVNPPSGVCPQPECGNRMDVSVLGSFRQGSTEHVCFPFYTRLLISIRSFKI